MKKVEKIIEWLVFSQLFYAICAVMLALETLYYFEVTNISIPFLCLIAFGVIFYYNFANISNVSNFNNSRSNWYQSNFKNIIFFQKLIGFVAVTLINYFLILYGQNVAKQPFLVHLFSVLSIAFGFLYYKINWLKSISGLRNSTFLKSIIIGFVWACIVVFFPLWFDAVSNATVFYFTNNFWVHFFYNFLFISNLALLFDIKDFELDDNLSLKTVVIKFGIKKTIYFIAIPIFVLLCIFMIVCMYQTSSILFISLIIGFHLFCILISLMLLKKMSVIFYLFVVDGLMLLKAILFFIALK
jgi:hypothetical protein